MAAKAAKRKKTLLEIETERAEKNRSGFQINLSIEEKVALKKAADAAGVGLSTWIRQVALERAQGN